MLTCLRGAQSRNKNFTTSDEFSSKTSSSVVLYRAMSLSKASGGRLARSYRLRSHHPQRRPSVLPALRRTANANGRAPYECVLVGLPQMLVSLFPVNKQRLDFVYNPRDAVRDVLRSTLRVLLATANRLKHRWLLSGILNTFGSGLVASLDLQCWTRSHAGEFLARKTTKY